MKSDILKMKYSWAGIQQLPPLAYQCGYCNNRVSSVSGYKLALHRDGSGNAVGGIYLCPHCGEPTYRDPSGKHIPDVPFGSQVGYVPSGIAQLYEEARLCSSAGAYTGAVMLCRKILMHLGVDKGAEEGKGFVHYVNYLSDKGYVPPDGKHWVDHIRKKGNEANHEIIIMMRDDASELILFIEMLLKFMYEFPAIISPSQGTSG